MKEIVIDKAKLKRLLIHYHGLDKYELNIMQYFDRVGCVQYDPLDIVGKNAELVLQSKVRDFKKIDLYNLLYEERKLVDGWDKQMSIYKSEDFAKMSPVRNERGLALEGTLRNRFHFEALRHTETVLEFIKLNGPSMPKDIDLGTVDRGTWGHGKVSSVVMDYLYTSGKLSLEKKIGTQKVYDLTERLLPEEFITEDNPMTENEFRKWYLLRRVGALGVYWDKAGQGWLGSHLQKTSERRKLLTELWEEGKLLRLKAKGMKETLYMRSIDGWMLDSLPNQTFDEVRFLAPLDNMIWDRDFIREVFGFEYTWEVYVPRAKRKYGYYVLPVLYGDRFIARTEPLPDGNGGICFDNWWWEEGYTPDENCLKEIEKAKERFVAFNGGNNG